MKENKQEVVIIILFPMNRFLRQNAWGKRGVYFPGE